MLEQEKEKELLFFNKPKLVDLKDKNTAAIGFMMLCVVVSIALAGLVQVKSVTKQDLPAYSSYNLIQSATNPITQQAIFEIKNDAKVAYSELSANKINTNAELSSILNNIDTKTFLKKTAYLSHNADKSLSANRSVREVADLRMNAIKIDYLKSKLSTLPKDQNVLPGYLTSSAIFLEELSN